MIALFAATASLAVLACVTAPAETTAISGIAFTPPSPVITTVRGGSLGTVILVTPRQGEAAKKQQAIASATHGTTLPMKYGILNSPTQQLSTITDSQAVPRKRMST